MMMSTTSHNDLSKENYLFGNGTPVLFAAFSISLAFPEKEACLLAAFFHLSHHGHKL